MPHSYGYRARTRDKFSKNFKCHGLPTVSRYLQTFKRGEYVDIMVDPSVQKGMPYHYYHGKTGKVYNVTRRSVGVMIKKRVRYREMIKRIHVRIEHVRKSRCREDFLKRCVANSKLQEEAKAKGVKVDLRRKPKGPREGEFVQLPADGLTYLEPQKFIESY